MNKLCLPKAYSFFGLPKQMPEGLMPIKFVPIRVINLYNCSGDRAPHYSERDGRPHAPAVFSLKRSLW